MTDTSEATSTSRPEETGKAVPPSLWSNLVGASVLVQLRPEVSYISVTQPNQAVMQLGLCDADGKVEPVGYMASGGVAAAVAELEQREAGRAAAAKLEGDEEKDTVPREVVAEPVRGGILQGTLNVLADAKGTMLEISFRDPLDQSKDSERPTRIAKVIFPPDFVGFLTRIERNILS